MRGINTAGEPRLSNLFPYKSRDEIDVLYSFLRFADNLADGIPPNQNGFDLLRETFHNQLQAGYDDVGQPILNYNNPSNEQIELTASSFAALANKYNIPVQLADEFLGAMQKDLEDSLEGGRIYQTWDESNKHIAGEAESVGLMASKILGIQGIDDYIRKFSRADQIVNDVLGIKEDYKAGFQYIPLQELKKYQLENLGPEYVMDKMQSWRVKAFGDLVRGLFVQAKHDFLTAASGYKAIENEDALIAIRTMAALEKLLMEKVEKNPIAVYDKKIEPGVVEAAIILKGEIEKVKPITNRKFLTDYIFPILRK